MSEPDADNVTYDLVSSRCRSNGGDVRNVTGMTGNGTVVVTIPAAAATDADANASAASTSTDNTVSGIKTP